jgi:hypothetical protein
MPDEESAMKAAVAAEPTRFTREYVNPSFVVYRFDHQQAE